MAESRGPLARLRALSRENGAAWTVSYVLERGAERAGAHRLSRRLWVRRAARERARGLTGTHTSEANRAAWNAYDWSGAGDEWSVSPEWRQALIDEVMLTDLPDDAVALEIGPGAGRWSVALRRACRELILADVSERALELCRERLREFDRITFHLTDGASLAGIRDSSVDFVWSFDAFVHIAPADQGGYLIELARVMRPGARGVIHHAGSGGAPPGVEPEAWRSSMTAERFAELARANGLQVVEQRERWGHAGEFAVPQSGDVITTFERS